MNSVKNFELEKRSVKQQNGVCGMFLIYLRFDIELKATNCKH